MLKSESSINLRWNFFLIWLGPDWKEDFLGLVEKWKFFGPDWKEDILGPDWKNDILGPGWKEDFLVLVGNKKMLALGWRAEIVGPVGGGPRQLNGENTVWSPHGIWYWFYSKLDPGWGVGQ